MHDAARLSDHAAARIQQLQSEGIILTPAEIVRINALGWNVETPETRLALSRGVPVSVGGVTLWPLTLRSYDWHQRVCGCMGTVWLGKMALAYAMAHGYDKTAALDVYGVYAVAAVAVWGAGLRCRMQTLVEAMAQIIQQDESEPVPCDPNAPPLGLGDLSASVSAITGMTPDEVETGMSMPHALRVVHYAIQAQEKVDGGKAQSAAYARACRAMGLYVHEIRQSRKAAANGTA